MIKQINIVNEQNIKTVPKLIDCLFPDYIYVPVINKLVCKTKNIRIDDEITTGYYSSISGTIKDLVELNNKEYIRIENDFKEVSKGSRKSKKSFSSLSKEQFLKILPELSYLDNSKIKNIYINCIDQEPTFFNKHYLLKNNMNAVISTVEDLLSVFNIKTATFIFNPKEDNLLDEFTSNLGINSTLKTRIIPCIYPLGNKEALRRFLEADQTKEIIDINEIYKIYTVLRRNKLVSSTYITISGNAIKESIVIHTKLYTNLLDILSNITYLNEDYDIILNNSLCGKKVNKNYIISPNTKGFIINKKNKIITLPCSNCGLCNLVCPLDNNPKNKEKCIKCGLCNYICPSKIELVKGDEDE